MRRPIGVSSSSLVATPGGMVRADAINKGDEVLVMVDGVVSIAPVRQVDRGLCCTLVRVVSANGARVCLGSDTLLVPRDGGVVSLKGNRVLSDSIIGTEPLHFCQHAIHFYCGKSSAIFVSGPGGPALAVDANFMERT